MSERDNGGPAFPIAGSERGPERAGTSLRDWVAGQALTGFLQAAGADAINLYPPSMAKRFYDYADAMLEARK